MVVRLISAVWQSEQPRRQDLQDMKHVANFPANLPKARKTAALAGLVITFLCSFLVANALAGAKRIPEIYAASISADQTRTRFTAHMNFAVGYNVYVLTRPYRVIIDIPDAVFNLPPDEGSAGKGLIRAFRYGQIDSGRSRIVMDATGPVLIKKSFALRAKPGRPARLVVDLVKTDEATFRKIHQVDQVANLVAREQARGDKNTDKIIPRELPPISADNGSRDAIALLLKSKNLVGSTKKTPRRRKKDKSRFTVVIDPGHGGVDSGTSTRNGIHEKNIVLAFSRKLKKHLEQTGRYRVVMTRNDDSFVALRKRVQIAHKAGADLFLAIHADAIRYKSVRGTTFYTLSDKASDKEAAELATRENRADIIGGINLGGESKAVTNILIDLAQRETKNHSVYFARKGIYHLKRVTRLARHPLRAAGFVVLKAPDVPSVLIELGYLSNRQDAKLLNTGRWQRNTSRALAKAVDSFFRARIALQ